MLDIWHTPQGSTAVTQQWFYARGSDWQPYELPRGCSQVFIFAFGGGGGGGGGLSGAAGTAGRGGGSGGGSGALTRSLFPRFALSDLIYIQPGSSVGTGAAIGSAGSNGGNTYVALVPSTTALYLYLLANGGGAGQAGTATTNSAGAGGAITTSANCALNSSANWISIAGQAGGTGGSGNGSNGSSVTWGQTVQVISGGCGGGGTTNTNGNTLGAGITAGGLFPATPSAAVPGGDGSPGISFWKPFMACGGGGGGAFGTGTAGNGAVGSYGSGGGGGGGGVTGGAGGDGGNGLVLIVCW
jgi:hypothetical protein